MQARKLFVIGIGPGGLDQVTYQAASAIAQVDHWLVADKGEDKADLIALRDQVLERYSPHKGRLITVPDPKRGPDAERDAAEYDAGVRDWHGARVEIYSRLIADLPPDDAVGFLVWGDPAFYDSTLRIVDALRADHDVEVSVVPGISAPQQLAAAHQIPLNRIGQPIHITTGRRLVAEYSPSLGDVVVMLDGHLACRELVETHPDLEIFWGAYLGAPEEVLRRGRLADVIDEIAELRAGLRHQRGWIMDTYLLRPAG